eukprot:TRINITY_DN2077_c0_g1_i11.p1 TRINITY_DN2077_c0_g1~~TRINITY_DN2077_c0_g1_i11.p1  ORF type:complete len:231 (+),score=60.43 TRINITY_DN2077_c0_g1_i11:164-856(+)
MIQRIGKLKGLILGLDGSGKSVILYRLKFNEPVTTIPTIGFNIETFTYKNVEFTMFDLGGADKVRGLHSHYYDATNFVIFVVDANDSGRFEEAKKLLDTVRENPKLLGIPFLVYFNKMDLAVDISPQELTQFFKTNANNITGIPCIGKTGEGLNTGLDWIMGQFSFLFDEDGEISESVIENRLKAAAEVVNRLGNRGGVVVESIRKILAAEVGEEILVDAKGQAVIERKA